MNKETHITPAALSALAKDDLENFLVAATPGGIEAQEARGQQAFVNSATLPREFNSGTREELEQMGVRFGADIDDLFCQVELPPGWRKVAEGHSMWSKLVDDKGRERASVFYKAAFYDRKAHINLSPRFRVSSYHACDADGNFLENGEYFATVILDGGNPRRAFGVRPSEYSTLNTELRDKHCDLAHAWLKEFYPDYQSHTAYWDTEEGV